MVSLSYRNRKTMDAIVKKAKLFATQAHRRIDQRRKYSKQPYDVHLKAVAEAVASVTDDAEMIAAAWLHDVVEDTPATIEDIEREFGGTVTMLVAQLTDVSRAGDGNREARKAIDREHTAHASPQAKTIKLADLIDNCRDICKHDSHFAPTYLAEMGFLLEVLKEGDPRLFQRAQKVLGECSERLGLGKCYLTIPDAEAEWTAADHEFVAKHPRLLRFFARAFSAEDIAEPLRSFDETRSAREVRNIMGKTDSTVAGVRSDGRVSGYLLAHALGDGDCGAFLHGFRQDQVISGDAALSEVIETLTRHDHCFVTVLGQVAGVIRRPDIQKPLVRMWLFGMITFAEMDFAERVHMLWPDGSWTRLLPAGRVQKAEELHAERQRRQQPCSLLDCLQLSDKAQILMQNPLQLAAFGFETKGAAQRVVKELESLRNNLAHAQDIVAHDWPQIVRLARRFEVIINNPGKKDF